MTEPKARCIRNLNEEQKQCPDEKINELIAFVQSSNSHFRLRFFVTTTTSSFLSIFRFFHFSFYAHSTFKVKQKTTFYVIEKWVKWHSHKEDIFGWRRGANEMCRQNERYWTKWREARWKCSVKTHKNSKIHYRTIHRHFSIHGVSTAIRIRPMPRTRLSASCAMALTSEWTNVVSTLNQRPACWLTLYRCSRRFSISRLDITRKPIRYTKNHRPKATKKIKRKTKWSNRKSDERR